MEFAHRQCFWHLLVFLLAHPVGPLGLAPNDEVVTCPEAFSGTKVGAAFARPILLEQAVDTAALQLAKQEIGREERVTEEDVAVREPIEHTAQQCLLVATLALAGAGGCIEQRAACQAHQRHHPHHRKTQPLALAGRLGIFELVLFGIGQRHRRAIGQANASTLPKPPVGNALGKDLCRSKRQCRNHRLWQAGAGLAIGGGIGATLLHFHNQSFDRGIIHGLLAAAV